MCLWVVTGWAYRGSINVRPSLQPRPFTSDDDVVSGGDSGNGRHLLALVIELCFLSQCVLPAGRSIFDDADSCPSILLQGRFVFSLCPLNS